VKRALAAFAVVTLAVSGARAECTIAGRLSDERVRVTSIVGRAPRYVAISDAEAIVTPLRHGLVHVRSTLPDGRAFEGESRHEPRYEIASHTSMPGLELGAGTEVLDLEAIAGTDEAEVDLRIAPGVTLRELRIGCSALAIASAERRPTDLALPSDVASPRLRPRSRDLHVTSGAAVHRLRFEAPDDVVVLERSRREDRLDVTLAFADAVLRGSVEARDVVPIVESLIARHRWYRRPRRP
jgi:hypothetical protein